MLRSLVLACALLLVALPAMPDPPAAPDHAEMAGDMALPSAPGAVRLRSAPSPAPSRATRRSCAVLPKPPPAEGPQVRLIQGAGYEGRGPAGPPPVEREVASPLPPASPPPLSQRAGAAGLP